MTSHTSDPPEGDHWPHTNHTLWTSNTSHQTTTLAVDGLVRGDLPDLLHVALLRLSHIACNILSNSQRRFANKLNVHIGFPEHQKQGIVIVNPDLLRWSWQLVICLWVLLRHSSMERKEALSHVGRGYPISYERAP